MQKNKFIREDIKAVCNSAAKKLVALGLAVAVGGTCTIGGSCNRVVRAQTQAETNSETQPNANETQRRIDNLMQVRRERRIARCSQFWTAARLDGQEALERRQIAENPDHLNQLEDDEILYWGASPTIFGHDAEIRHPNIDLIRNWERQLENERALRITALERQLENERARRRTAEGRAQMLERRQNQHIGAGSGGRQTITGNTMLQVRGENHIEAWSDTHIHSLSNNDLLHEGDGAVNVDRGDIIISECSNGQTTRDVTVNNAHRLNVAPHIYIRIRNGTAFPIGRTAQDTRENLQRAMGLPTPSSNLFVRFVCALISLFTFTLSGRWFGGSK